MMAKNPLFHCVKCGKNTDAIAKAGRYLQRISPLGTDFIGECSPCCEYHEIKVTDNTALLNCLNDVT